MKIGFYRNLDVSCGGVGPYGNRVFHALNEGKFASAVTISEITSDDLMARQPEVEPANPLRPNRIRKIFKRLQRASNVLHGRPPTTSVDPLPVNLNLRPIDELSLDLLHVPYQTPPAYDLGVPFIVTMHDVQELHFPQYFTAEERAYRATEYLRAIRHASAVVVSFEHVRQDLIRFFGCSEDKVFTIPLPYAACELEHLDKKHFTPLVGKHPRKGTFFLYPAQTWEHKNHLRLIEAFEQVCLLSESDSSLVCTGKKNNFFTSKISDRVAQSSASDRIFFPGIVEEHELRWLYENCLGVVIPTLYEAGSFPLIEAMSLSVPVICAETTSLPSTIGNSRFVFNPHDVESISSMMMDLLNDPSFRQLSKENSERQMKSLKSVDVCSAYESLWQAVLGR